MSAIAVTLGYLYEYGLADGRVETQFNDEVSYRQQWSRLDRT